MLIFSDDLKKHHRYFYSDFSFFFENDRCELETV